jgi:anti-sigma regulatory factor (Ser/Thr protein kinase)
VVSLTVENEGVPFNPLDAPAANDTAPIEERPIGRLGIHLLRKLMDEIEYAREGNRNRLVVRKRVSGSAVMEIIETKSGTGGLGQLAPSR